MAFRQLILVALALSSLTACTRKRDTTPAQDAAVVADAAQQNSDAAQQADASCTSECSLAGITSCRDERTRLECVVTNGCGRWQAQTCTSAQECSGGECVDMCIRGQIDSNGYCQQLRMAWCGALQRCCDASEVDCSGFTNAERTSVSSCASSTRIWDAQCPAAGSDLRCQEDVLTCAGSLNAQDCEDVVAHAALSTCDGLAYE